MTAMHYQDFGAGGAQNIAQQTFHNDGISQPLPPSAGKGTSRHLYELMTRYLNARNLPAVKQE